MRPIHSLDAACLNPKNVSRARPLRAFDDLEALQLGKTHDLIVYVAIHQRDMIAHKQRPLEELPAVENLEEQAPVQFSAS